MIRSINTEADMTIRPFEIADEDSVVALWERCGLTRPWNDPCKDIQRKLAVRPDLFLVGILDQEIIATVMAGYDGHRGWINYLAVDSSQRRQNYGRAIMEAAERMLRESGAPKINLQVRAANSEVITFYQRLGYAVEDVVNLGKRLVEDGPRVE
jgi:ribosomal protein S18 acetylase RimI-like enzyme